MYVQSTLALHSHTTFNCAIVRSFIMALLLSGLRSTVGAALRSHGLVGSSWSAVITSASGPRAFAGDAERPPPRDGEKGEEETGASAPEPSPEEPRPSVPRSEAAWHACMTDVASPSARHHL